MARRPELHSADELISPALARTIKAIGAPASDDALVALARVLAATMDRMSNQERAAMIGQTAPQMIKVLDMLEDRARRRRAAEQPAPAANPIHAMRAQHAARFGA